jgi:diaminopimelate decarboxylase
MEQMSKTVVPVPELTTRTLRATAEQFGTPSYAYDIQRLRTQVRNLRATLPPAVGLLYSLKANPSLGLCALLGQWGLGADVASAGELATALEGGIAPTDISISGPYKPPELLALLAGSPGATLSVDSVSELQLLAARREKLRAVLRLRPDFPSAACVDAGQGSRFGIPISDLHQCRDLVASSTLQVVGFHVFAGSQVLDTTAVVSQLRAALDLTERAAALLHLRPEVVNLGGGFGVPYAPGDLELDLSPIAEELEVLVQRVAPTRIVLELGRYIVAQAGWYLTRVVALQHQGERPAVVVDGGTHQRADLCGLGLPTRAIPPLLLGESASPPRATDVWGCLCLPSDVLAEGTLLPALTVGDILAFPNAGAYGLSASPTLFLSHPAPAEVAFDGRSIELLRPRQAASSLMMGQSPMVHLHP